MQPLGIKYISPYHCCLWSRMCSLFYESLNQIHIELQVWQCFHRLVKPGHMCHNVRVEWVLVDVLGLSEDAVNSLVYWMGTIELHQHFVIVIVHNVRVHNGGINDMEHYPMPSFVVMHLQSIISTKLIVHINSMHVLLVMY